MKKLKIIICCSIIIFLSGSFEVFGQENEVKLKDKRISIQMDKQPLGKVFQYLILKYDIPIGFEESTFDRDHQDYLFETNLPFAGKPKSDIPKAEYHAVITSNRIFTVKENWITVNVVDGTLEEVFNSIVGQMKNYQWEINDGVVNIFPNMGRDERYEKLLNLKIKNYYLEKGAPIGLIRTAIFELPEVVKFLNENNIKFKFVRANPYFIGRVPMIEFNYSNLTFRELLNKITKAKKGGWLLKENDLFGSKEDEYIELEI